MARPRIHSHPRKLNLSVNLDTKRKAFDLATRQKCSISDLLSKLVHREFEKLAQK